MKILLILFLLVSCEKTNYKNPHFSSDDIKMIFASAKANKGLKNIQIRFKNNYIMNFNNGNQLIVGSKLCPSVDCLTLTEDDFKYCEEKCLNNNGLNILTLSKTCEDYQYLGVIGGKCGYYKEHYLCSCNNQVTNYKVKITDKLK